MAGSSFGTLFRITTWGETHGAGVGVVVDGCPAGLPLCEENIQKFLDRRKPGQSKYTTQRKEGDEVTIMSGVFDGKTTGTAISLVVHNTNQRSKDYSKIQNIYRPGHADFTFDAKYGFRDYRGGGRSSGRETIGRVAAGAIASKLLGELGITVKAYAKEIAGITAQTLDFDAMLENPFYMPDGAAAEKVSAIANEMLKEQDSLGGIIECVATGVKPGVGDPVFDKLSANLGKAVLSIGAIKGFEIGDGFKVAKAKGSTNNDVFSYEDGTFSKVTNHSGGLLGGMSDGSEILLRAAVKPTPSIAKIQKTVDQDGNAIDLSIQGRHDPMIVPRAVVVVESMVAITILDGVLMDLGSTVDKIKKIYE